MIKRIKISDFKSIHEVELELDPITVLVGRSGTGKSNLVQAIRFLRNVLIHQELAVNYEGGWHRIVPVGEQKPRPSIEVTFSIPGEDADYTYGITFKPEGSPHNQLLSSERLLLGNELVFSRNFTHPPHVWEWGKAPEVVPVPSHVGTPMLGSFPSLHKVVFAYAALSTSIGYYHFPSTTLDPARQADPREAFLQNMPGLSDTAANYREIMRGITQDFRHPNLRKSLLKTLQAVNPSIASVELDSLTNPQKAVVGHRANGRIFELSLEQESDGLRRFYAHLLALYQSMPKLTLVFEEPENAIFPGALSLLADEFKAAARENRGQVILTTHNPILLDSFDVDNVRVVEMRDGKTVVGRVSKEQRDAVKEHLLTTGELLTVEQPKMDDAPPPAEQTA